MNIVRGKQKVDCKNSPSILFSSAGFSLSEMLVAVLILSLVTTGLAVGISSSVRVYQQSVQFSETQTLSAALVTAIEDELRFSYGRKAGDENPAFSSRTYGEDVTMAADVSGKIVIEKIEADSSGSKNTAYLISAGLYPSGIMADLAYTYTYEGNVYDVTLTLHEGDPTKPIDEIIVKVVPLTE